MKITTALIVPMLVLSLSACGTQDIKQLSEVSIPAIDFRSHAAAKYQALVRFEADEMYDHLDASRFANKALGILSKQIDPVPEDPSQWQVEAKFQQAIGNAYGRLRTALKLKTDRIEPEATAEALVAFDCWVEQAEEGWQLDHIKSCQDRFEAALSGIEARLDIKVGTTQAHQKIVVYFDTDEAVVSSQNIEQLRTQLASLPLIGDQSVRIIGHADRVGSERYNDGLSLRRAIQVHRILSAGGMDVSKIGVMSKGERDNAVATADERPEPRNRRAEVEVKWSFTD